MAEGRRMVRTNARARVRARRAVAVVLAVVVALAVPATAGAEDVTTTTGPPGTVAPAPTSTTTQVADPGTTTTTTTAPPTTVAPPTSMPSVTSPVPGGPGTASMMAAEGEAMTPSYVGAPWFRPGSVYTQNFPDPTVVWDPVGERYWAYSTSTGGPILPAMWSTDLTTWTARSVYSPNPYNGDRYFNDAFPVPPSWSYGGTSRDGKAQWAPGVARINGVWLAYTSWEIVPGRRCISVASSSAPEGPFVDTSSRPLVCDVDPAGSIDPEPFIDADGKPYLLWKAEGIPGFAPTTLKARPLSADGRSFAPGTAETVLLSTALPWEGNVIENPSMVRVGGTYRLTYSGNEWESADYRTGQAVCSGPLGPCTRSSDTPLMGNTSTQLGAGGGSMFVDRTGRLRMIHHYWNAPFSSYPSDPNCDGGGQCASRGQRYQRIEGLTVSAGRLTVDPVGSFDGASVSGGTVTVSGWALDPSTTSAIQVHVYVDGAIIAWTADGNRPDVGAAYPGLGADHGFSLAFEAGPGSHQVCVYGIGVGTPGNPLFGCRTVLVADRGPFGNLDVVTTSPGALTASGWAIDPDSADPITVNLVVDGVVSPTTADRSRPDVGALHPSSGPNHGFSRSVSVAGGPRTVCAVGLNVGAGTNSVLGCRTVTVPGGDPFGSLDGVTVVPGGVRASGWTIDPDGPSAVQVHVYVDNAIAPVLADQPRPDVGAAYPGYGDAHGYTLDVAAPPGPRRVCAYAINQGTGTVNSLLGCRSVVVPDASPFGSLDSVTGGTGTIGVGGWTIDPDTPDPIQVHLYFDDVILPLTARTARPDVGAVYPTSGPNHGFTVVIGAAPGTHRVCAYAINVGAGTSNTQLGCRSVVVS